MKENVREVILRIKNDHSEGTPLNEEATKQSMILPVLNALDWSIFNHHEVKPEYAVGSSRVDYALMIDGRPKVFLEAKKVNESLEGHEEQLLNYSFKRGVKMAVLTNGITWWFYLPLKEGDWDERKFYTIELTEQDIDDMAQMFIDILSKDVVASGEYIRNAEKVLENKAKKKIIDRTLPQVWKKLMEEPSEELIDIIASMTENMCGYRPDDKHIRKFLSETKTRNMPVITHQQPARGTHQTPTTPKKSQESAKSSNYVRSGFIGEKPEKIILLGKEYIIKFWKDILLITADELFSKHPEKIDEILGSGGNKWVYFSKEPYGMSQPRKLRNHEIYVETKFNANMIVSICQSLLQKFGYSENDLEIYTR